MICRHCHKELRNWRLRGLCWKCHKDLSIRKQYPSLSKYGRYHDEGEPTMDALDRMIAEQMPTLPDGKPRFPAPRRVEIYRFTSIPQRGGRRVIRGKK